MYGLFGITSHTLSHVHDRLLPMAQRLGATIRVAATPTATNPLPDWPTFQREWRTTHAVLFPGLRELHAWAPMMEKAPFVGFVHDSPLMLNEITGLSLLDTHPEGNGFSFRLSPLDLRPAEGLLRASVARKGTHAQLHILKQIDLIATIIDQEREGQFLDKYNAFLYRCTGAAARNAIRKAIVLHLFGYWTVAQMTTLVYRYIPARGLAMVVYTEMLAWLASSDGQKLRAALAEIRQAKGNEAAINYTSICKRHKVDRYELRYLTLLLRREQNKAKPATMREVASAVRSKRATTMANKAGLEGDW